MHYFLGRFWKHSEILSRRPRDLFRSNLVVDKFDWPMVHMKRGVKTHEDICIECNFFESTVIFFINTFEVTLHLCWGTRPSASLMIKEKATDRSGTKIHRGNEFSTCRWWPFRVSVSSFASHFEKASLLLSLTGKDWLMNSHHLLDKIRWCMIDWDMAWHWKIRNYRSHINVSCFSMTRKMKLNQKKQSEIGQYQKQSTCLYFPLEIWDEVLKRQNRLNRYTKFN